MLSTVKYKPVRVFADVYGILPAVNTQTTNAETSMKMHGRSTAKDPVILSHRLVVRFKLRPLPSNKELPVRIR